MCAIYVVLSCVCRFGLGWAHDVFTFARHMLMHFHAYIPSFSYIIIYFVLVLFRLYLCLSLSLSFYVCLLLWHPMRSKAYSSSDPTPSSVQFYDENAWKDFLENFCRRGIHLECHVILSDFSDTDLPTVIHSKGWESLCDIRVTCLSMIIQEFYSNMHGIDTSVPYFFFHVRGTHIVDCSYSGDCLRGTTHS